MDRDGDGRGSGRCHTELLGSFTNELSDLEGTSRENNRVRKELPSIGQALIGKLKDNVREHLGIKVTDKFVLVVLLLQLTEVDVLP